MKTSYLTKVISRAPVALLALLTLGFQGKVPTLAPDEVRITSRRYEPRITFRSDIKLLQLEVVVRDSHGEPVSGLTAADFLIEDGGKPRATTAFAIQETMARLSSVAHGQPRPTPSPTPEKTMGPTQQPGRPLLQTLSIALLFDDLGTSTGDLAHAKAASVRFVKEAVSSGDRIAVFTASAGRVLDFTSDSAAILHTFDTIQAHQRVPPGGLAACPRITAFDAYRIVNNDPGATQAAVARACNCAGDASCNLGEGTPTGELMTPTSVGANNTYGGGGTVSSLISSVKAQASQTWDLTRMVSQTTLERIDGALEQLQGQPGKHMLLLASSGFLSGSLEAELDKIINDAIQRGIVINCLDAKGLYAENPAGNFADTESMTKVPIASLFDDAHSLGDRLDSVDSAPAKFAESTGGLMFKNNNDLSLGFYRLGMVPTVTYLLAFPPAEDGKYHKITVKLAKKTSGEFVQVRPGYQAPLGAGAKQASADPLDNEVAGKDAVQDISVTVEAQPGAAGQHKLTLRSHVDLQKLPFQHQKDRQVEKLTFIAALYDDKGTFVTGKEAEMDLALKPDSFTRLSASGIKTAMTLEAPAGSYRLRTVIQEGVQHKMAAANQEVTIP